MTRKLRKLLFLAPRLAALLATSYLLVATSQVPVDNCAGAGGCGGSQSQLCYHPSDTAAFHVTGSCGPEGDIVVASGKDECAITVQGADDVNLPAAGRFEDHGDSTVSLSTDAWTLSGYPPESALPDASPAQPDAGIFTVVRDAQASSDVGGFSVTPGSGGQGGAAGQHGTPTVRTCSYFPNATTPPSLSCTGGGLADCVAILNRL